MRITIPTTGSLGDVQPYVALGVGLQARGHKVCLATHADFESFIRGHGLEIYPLEQGGQTLQASDTGDRMLRSGTNALAFLREFTELRRPLLHHMLHCCWLACRGADVILSTNTEFLLAEAVADGPALAKPKNEPYLLLQEWWPAVEVEWRSPSPLIKVTQMTLVQILLAIFLPPVAAFMKVGFGLQFWINCLLTLLAFFPGMIHALWLVARK